MTLPTLSTRERRLLLLCGITLVTLVTLFLLQEYNQKLAAVREAQQELRDELVEHETWLGEAAYYAGLSKWISEHLPPLTDSAGRTQGQLLDELQDSALNVGLNMERPNLLAPSSTAYYQEVAIRMRVRGEQIALLRWLTTLQRPDQFRTITSMEIELDRNAGDTEPQAVCNLTVARWFHPETEAETDS